jgi:hypothetical protein
MSEWIAKKTEKQKSDNLQKMLSIQIKNQERKIKKFIENRINPKLHRVPVRKIYEADSNDPRLDRCQVNIFEMEKHVLGKIIQEEEKLEEEIATQGKNILAYIEKVIIPKLTKPRESKDDPPVEKIWFINEIDILTFEKARKERQKQIWESFKETGGLKMILNTEEIEIKSKKGERKTKNHKFWIKSIDGKIDVKKDKIPWKNRKRKKLKGNGKFTRHKWKNKNWHGNLWNYLETNWRENELIENTWKIKNEEILKKSQPKRRNNTQEDEEEKKDAIELENERSQNLVSDTENANNGNLKSFRMEKKMKRAASLYLNSAAPRSNLNLTKTDNWKQETNHSTDEEKEVKCTKRFNQKDLELLNDVMEMIKTKILEKKEKDENSLIGFENKENNLDFRKEKLLLVTKMLNISGSRRDNVKVKRAVSFYLNSAAPRSSLELSQTNHHTQEKAFNFRAITNKSNFIGNKSEE